MIDIGNIIINEVKNQGKTIHQLAREVNMSKPGLYRLLKRKDLKVSYLLLFSRILNHDFLQHYRTGPVSLPDDYQQLQKENKQLKQQVQVLQRENTLLNDIVQLLKSQIKQD